MAYREVSPKGGFVLMAYSTRRLSAERDDMEAVIEILEKPAEISWDYDEEADVLYLSMGEPRPAVGVDTGEGVVARYDETDKEVAGITLIGLRGRLLKELNQSR